MLTINDVIEEDVLIAVMRAPERRLRRCEIRDALFRKYKKQYKNTRAFDVILQRRLDRLCVSGALEKDYVKRAAFYYVPEEAKDEIGILVDKLEIQSRIDQMTVEDLKAFKPLLQMLGKIKAVATKNGFFDGKGNRITKQQYRTLAKKN